MATQDESTLKAQFETFAKDAYLDVLLPRFADLEVSKTLREGTPKDLHGAPSRRNVFFDERVTTTILLKTLAGEDEVRTVLSSLEINLSAHATDAVPQGSGNAASASGKHDLTSRTFPASECIDIVRYDGSIYVVWKPTLHLPRPRARLQRPAVYFTAYLNISAAAMQSNRQAAKDYLPSLEPLPANVLEALQFDPSLSSPKITLSETRITKVLPSAGRVFDDVKPIRGASKRAFPIVPALFTRVRYSALTDAIVASLHLETSHVLPGTISLKRVDFDVPMATVEALNTLEFPKECIAGDESVLLYKLKPRAKGDATGLSTVSVNIEAIVASDETSIIELDIGWQAQVDLLQTSAKPIYRWSQPLSVPGAQTPARPTSFAGPHDAAPSSSSKSGVTFNFWTPSTMPPKIDFKINVQCINHSNRSRRFAIVLLQSRKFLVKAYGNAASIDSEDDREVIADLFNAPPVERQRPPDVFDLNPDMRIGPIPPGACYETELKFWAATTGVLDLGVARIIDLETRQTVDVKELPDVVVLDPSAE